MRVPQRDDETEEWTQVWPFKKFYSILEVSYMLWMATHQLYDHLRTGKLKGVKVGKYIHIEHSELKRFIERRIYASGMRDNPNIKVEPYIPRNAKGVQVSEAIERIHRQQLRDVEGESEVQE